GEVVENDNGSSVEYRVTIADADDQPVAEIVRRYSLAPGSYDLRLEQRVINRTAAPLRVVWEQNAQADLPADDASYMGDRRLVATGYFNLHYDPQRTNVYTNNAFVRRQEVIEARSVWPTERIGGDAALAWLAAENRYF